MRAHNNENTSSIDKLTAKFQDLQPRELLSGVIYLE